MKQLRRLAKERVEVWSKEAVTKGILLPVGNVDKGELNRKLVENFQEFCY